MKLRVLTSALVAAHLMSACGGGGSSAESTPDTATPAATTSLSGVASKGPLKAALVTAYAVDANGAVGTTKLAEKLTDGSGAYTLDLGRYSGAVQLVVTATASTKTADEATGQDQSLPSDFSLHANTVVAAASGTGTVTQSASITPYTELAHNIAKDSGGITAANIANANGVVFNLIGVDPVATRPLDSTATPPADATDAQKRYALLNAAVSKLAATASTTGDATTTQCFTAAGSDVGRKIQCATQQIATAVTVTTGSQGGTAVNGKLVGLAAALVSAAADTTINKTGTSIGSNDSTAKGLDAIEADVAAGAPVVIKGGTSTAERSDITLAKQFFNRLRSNAAALRNGPLETGLTDGVAAFGNSLRDEASRVTQSTGKVVRLADIAYTLWTTFKAGTTTNPNNVAITGYSGGCTVYQGAFPVELAAVGVPTITSSVVATSAANASWVGCSFNHGPLATGITQYRETVLFNMGASSYPATVPYIATSRKRFIEANATYQVNLLPTLAGTVGYVLTNGAVSGFSIVGDLPPTVKADGTLLAARYPVNVSGTVLKRASGAFQASFASGKFGVVPLGADTAALTVDLSPDGVSVVIAPDDATVAAQLADAKLSIAASIRTARGELKGSFVADSFQADGSGGVDPGHLKFTGSIAAAGSGGTVAPFLSGSLEVTDGSAPVVSFNGGLSLPNRPEASLAVSITQTPATASTAASYTLSGRYVQDGVTVQISGTQNSAGSSATFADSSSVSVSITSSGNTANVTVGGRQTGVIDKARSRITYSDGTFESLI